MYVCTDTCVNVSVFVGVCPQGRSQGGYVLLGSEDTPPCRQRKVHQKGPLECTKRSTI